MPLNGLCHEMNNFVKGLKNQSVLSAPIVFKLFCCHVMEKLKFSLASMKTLTNYENPSSNHLHTACCGIQEPAYDSVNGSVSRR
jgi:hypothetical protein